MPRPAAPWFRSSANNWYATVDGRKVSLGVRGEDNDSLGERPTLIIDPTANGHQRRRPAVAARCRLRFVR